MTKYIIILYILLNFIIYLFISIYIIIKIYLIIESTEKMKSHIFTY